MCVEEAFGQAERTVAVASLEHMNRDMAKEAESHLLTHPVPSAADEGEIMVVSADGKGIVMRRQPGAPPAHPGKGRRPAASGWPPSAHCTAWTATGPRRSKSWQPCSAMKRSATRIGPGRSTSRFGSRARSKKSVNKRGEPASTHQEATRSRQERSCKPLVFLHLGRSGN